MLTKGSALNVGKGWAVASLFRKARENRLTKFYLKTVGAFLLHSWSHTRHSHPVLTFSHHRTQRLIQPLVLAHQSLNGFTSGKFFSVSSFI